MLKWAKQSNATRIDFNLAFFSNKHPNIFHKKEMCEKHPLIVLKFVSKLSISGFPEGCRDLSQFPLNTVSRPREVSRLIV